MGGAHLGSWAACGGSTPPVPRLSRPRSVLGRGEAFAELIGHEKKKKRHVDSINLRRFVETKALTKWTVNVFNRELKTVDVN